MIQHDDGAGWTWPPPTKNARIGSIPTVTIDPCTPRPSVSPCVPPVLERAIAARWSQWVPWVRMQLLRQSQSDPAVNPAMDSPESRRLRQRHSELVIALMRDGISLRTIRRHRLDDPRINDDVRAMLVEAARERQSKAWFRRSAELRAQDRLMTLLKLGPIVRHAPGTHPSNEAPQRCPPAAMVIPNPTTLKEVIEAIRRLVCEHFYLREMLDPELTARTNRRAYVFPRQLAMYIVRQLTGASLQEIGQQFGGRHHSTVLYSIEKVEEMRRSNKALNNTITGLMDKLRSMCCELPQKSLS